MTNHPIRKQRAVEATDGEWNIVRAKAQAAGRSASDYIVRRALASDTSAGPSLGTLVARLDRIETAVLTLCEVERIRLAERGKETDWAAALRRVALRMQTEPAMTGRSEGAR